MEKRVCFILDLSGYGVKCRYLSVMTSILPLPVLSITENLRLAWASEASESLLHLNWEGKAKRKIN